LPRFTVSVINGWRSTSNLISKRKHCRNVRMKTDLTWETLDWSALDRLRNLYLSETPAGSYWSAPSDLDNYDFTYGRRIGWKWAAVLDELRRRGWSPPADDVFDWGCGSGIAGRAVIDFFAPRTFRVLRLHDQSSFAVDFAADRARKTFPELRIERATSEWLESREPLGLLVLSHVLNELSDEAKSALRQLVHRAGAVLWVEPGTYDISRQLIAWREEMRSGFHVLAPCTHQATCGLLTTENKQHWCHHFAVPPSGIMNDSNWVRFAQRAGIDLRRLPYSFLVLERKGPREPVPGLLPERWSRVIGEPRCYKGYAKIMSCQSAGVRELRLQQRAQPELFRAFRKGTAAVIYSWRTSGEDIQGAEVLDEGG
jgi:ribosomal protein RSM22 (predicted rRNA methylase)